MPSRAATDPARAALDPADEAPAIRRACEAWLAVQRALAFEPVRAAEILERFEEPVAALRAAGVRLRLHGGTPAADRRALAQCGGRIVPWPSARYPASLRAIPDPPPVLCVRGDIRVLGRPAVAIVGARAATAHGLETARTLGAALARRGLVVVSGLARGIDAAAHRGALEAGGCTVAVQACGLDRVYPPEHRSLADAIAGTAVGAGDGAEAEGLGAVVSELPMGMPPRAAHFPLRNRVISGLALAVVVVEARMRSGSLVTARHALAQGRDVLAVPGPVRTPVHEGPNRLLRDGARPLLDVEDALAALPDPVLAALAPLATTSATKSGRARARAPADRPIAARDRQLLDALEQEALERNGLTRRLAWSVSEVTARLLALELEGLVVQDRDGRFHRRHTGDRREARRQKEREGEREGEREERREREPEREPAKRREKSRGRRAGGSEGDPRSDP